MPLLSIASVPLETSRLLLRAWRYRLRLDPAEIAYLRGHLRRGDTAIDIGAHKGAYTYWMRKAVGRSGRVFSFEPQQELAAYLRRMKSRLSWDNVTIEQVALSSRTGTMDLTVPGGPASLGSTLESGLIKGARTMYEVQATTLDDYFARLTPLRIMLLKCDVEGHELDVFQGGRDLLESSRPVLLFECEDRHHTRYTKDDVFAFLRDLGYEGSFFAGGRFHPVGDFNPSLHGDPNSRNYVNNFVFRPRS